MNKNADIIIIGAGLVGTSLAVALKDLGLSVILLENHLLDINTSPNLHSRPISLAHSSILSLKECGLWDKLAPYATPIHHVHASTQHHFGRLKISAQDYGLEALGYVVPFDSLRHTLYKAALDTANIQPISNILAIETCTDGNTITVEQAGEQHQYTSTLLIGADGTRSQTRELLGIGTKQQNHQQIALTATLSLNKQLDTGYERFGPNGIVAVLPRQNNTAGLVWTMSDSEKHHIEALTDQELINKVQQIMGQRIGTISALKRGTLYPLVSIKAKQQYHQSALLLGNSAHSFYPIAAQGFNLSLRDTMTFAQCIRFALSENALNDPRLFTTYLQKRLDDQKRVQRLVSMTSTLFEIDLPGFNQLRQLGFLGLTLLRPLQKKIARLALGLSAQATPVRQWHE